MVRQLGATTKSLHAATKYPVYLANLRPAVAAEHITRTDVAPSSPVVFFSVWLRFCPVHVFDVNSIGPHVNRTRSQGLTHKTLLQV